MSENNNEGFIPEKFVKKSVTQVTEGLKYLTDTFGKVILLLIYIVLYFFIPFIPEASSFSILFIGFYSIVAIIYMYTGRLPNFKGINVRRYLMISKKNVIYKPIILFYGIIFLIFIIVFILGYAFLFGFVGAFFWKLIESIIFVAVLSPIVSFLYRYEPEFLKRNSILLTIILIIIAIFFAGIINLMFINYNAEDSVVFPFFVLKIIVVRGIVAAVAFVIVTLGVYWYRWRKTSSKRKQEILQMLPIIFSLVMSLFLILSLKYVFIDSSTEPGIKNISKPIDLLTGALAVLFALWKLTETIYKRKDDTIERKKSSRWLPPRPVYPYSIILLLYMVSLSNAILERSLDQFGFTYIALILSPVGIYFLIRSLLTKSDIVEEEEIKEEFYQARVASPKNRTITLILALILGFFGIHRYYVNKYDTGLIYTFTLGLIYIGWLYDIYKIIKGEFTDNMGRLISRW